METKNTNNEPQLVRELSLGNEEAFKLLFDTYRSKIFSYLFKLSESREVAENGIQDIFLKIWHQRQNMRDVDNFNAYLFKMAQNYAYSAFRSFSRQSLALEGLKNNLDILETAHPGKLLHSKETIANINRLINQLTPQQKAVFLMSRERGLKHEEIAQLLDISKLTVKKHMGDALRTLRGELQRNFDFKSYMWLFA